MRNHTKIYFDALGYFPGDFVCSELSGSKAVDIHHVLCKGMGGNPLKDKDRIENLQALTREEHEFYGDKKKHLPFLLTKHYNFLEANGVKFDKKYLLDLIEKHSVCTV